MQRRKGHTTKGSLIHDGKVGNYQSSLSLKILNIDHGGDLISK